MRVRQSAPAKINLFLRILAREESGFHQLETFFQSISLADEVELERDGEGIRLEVEGEGADRLGPPDQNLVVRAAALFERSLRELRGEPAMPRPGIRIHLLKRIPAGAGLGGGSSDAAAVLDGLNRMEADPLDRSDLLRIGGRLGADVPFFLSGSSSALAWGRGDRLLPLPALPSIPVLLALPRTPVPTPWAYRTLAGWREERIRTGIEEGLPGPHRLEPAALAQWGGIAREAGNDFEPPLFSALPELRVLRDAMRETGAPIVQLSGSGSALFALHPDRALLTAAAGELATRFPEVRFRVESTLD